MEENNFKIRDKRKRGWFYLDNEYLNGYARIIGVVGTAIYTSLCRHANNNQTCFPSQELIAEELGISAKTIRRHINKLKEYNIIAVEQKHDNRGRFLNNVYILMDKNVWKAKPIGQIGSTVESANRRDKLSITVGTNCPNKDTNIKKTNNISSTKIQKASYGNPEINKIYGLLREEIQGTPDGTIKENRKYAQLLLNKFKKDYPDRDACELVGLLIKAGQSDSFHSKNITSFKYLYFNAQKIIRSAKKNNNYIKL